MASYTIQSQNLLSYPIDGEIQDGTEVTAIFTADSGESETQKYWWPTTVQSELDVLLQGVAEHISSGYAVLNAE